MKIITIDIESKEYPSQLRKIFNPPKKLYAMGNIDLLNKPGIAIVGSRKMTDYGRRNCELFASELAKRNILIISGMAIGIDVTAHLEAIKNGSPTIAVLGTGFNNLYPKENIQVMHELLKKGGLIITEKEKNVEYDAKSFSKRNRIISGLSVGVLVIEAGIKSGTSVTVKYAKKQGKKVFALPGRLDLKNGFGTNLFIKNGAEMVTSVEEIINSYSDFKNIDLPKDKKRHYNKYETLLEILEDGKSLEEIVNILKKDKAKTLKLLLEMEAKGLIENVLGVGYRLIK